MKRSHISFRVKIWDILWSGESEKFLKEIIEVFPDFKELTIPQNPMYHPEGNVQVHTCLVINAVAQFKDKELTLAALYHDLGKIDTFDSKNLSFHKHEEFSTKRTEEDKVFLKRLGVNVDQIVWLVSQHMRIHNIEEMREKKRKELQNSPWFSKLEKLARADKDVRIL